MKLDTTSIELTIDHGTSKVGVVRLIEQVPGTFRTDLEIIQIHRLSNVKSACFPLILETASEVPVRKSFLHGKSYATLVPLIL